MELKNAILYAHGGSANHGCEAIVRSSLYILKGTHSHITVFSNAPAEDKRYGLHLLAGIKSPISSDKKTALEKFFFLLKMKILKSDYYFFKDKYRGIGLRAGNASVAYSVGGDNYCYPGFSEELRAINDNLKEKNIKTVLWGCSIEPSLLDMNLVKDLSSYDLIVARESITYYALQRKGLKASALIPDPAFLLERIDLPLPENFIEKNTVGINISPLITKLVKDSDIIRRSIEQLIDFIVINTEMNVALIPHVVWDHNDDRIPLAEIFSSYRASPRVIMLEDHNAMELKGFIARCRFFVAARTHASIAAYSQHVPTLVLGYSVKSRGIAKDLFGTDKNYVLPVEEIHNDKDVLEAFKFMMNNEKQILQLYSEKMDAFKSIAKEKYSEVLKLYFLK